jgi:hypothetical protein
LWSIKHFWIQKSLVKWRDRFLNEKNCPTSRYLKILFQCASWLGISQDILVNENGRDQTSACKYLKSFILMKQQIQNFPFWRGKFDFCYTWCLNKSNNRKKLQSFDSSVLSSVLDRCGATVIVWRIFFSFFRAALRFFKHHRPFPSRVLCHRLPLLFYLVPVRVSPLMIKVKKKYKKLWARLSLNKFYKQKKKIETKRIFCRFSSQAYYLRETPCTKKSVCKYVDSSFWIVHT